MSQLFHLLDPEKRSPDRAELLAQRNLPASLGSHRESAATFQPSRQLRDAVNVALAVGAPLLLTGEPGTGKTQVAYYLAWYFGIELFELHVRSNTTADDLIYQFDSIAYFHAAHAPGGASGPMDRQAFVHKGPLWRAIESARPSVLLLDEIDKAPRDFPNDILIVLDQHRFFVREWAEGGMWIERKLAPPIVIITSNSERRLPEPFLRRCIFHHIEFDEELLRRAVAARRKDFPALDNIAIDKAIERLLEIRQKPIRKKPATAELLVWLIVLSNLAAAEHGEPVAQILKRPLFELPALSALIKDRDDLQVLR